MYSKIRFAHPLEWRLKLNNKLYNNYPLLEIKDFGPPTTYGEDKDLKLIEKSSPHPTPPLHKEILRVNLFSYIQKSDLHIQE